MGGRYVAQDLEWVRRPWSERGGASASRCSTGWAHSRLPGNPHVDTARTRRRRVARGAPRGARGGPGVSGSAQDRRGRGCPRRSDEVRFASGLTRLGSPGEFGSTRRLSSSPQPSRPTVAHPPRRGGCGKIVTHAIDGPPRDRRRGRWRVLGIAAGAMGPGDRITIYSELPCW